MRTRVIAQALCVQVLLAVSASQGWAACLTPPLSAQSISEFKANPQALIAPDSDARTIEATTRDLAGTDASLAADLVRLAQATTPRFQTAIAAGLAQAAIACGSTDQQAALLIQQAVAGYQDGEFQSAFAAVAGDLSTAATEAATAFASSSVGSVVMINPNPSRGSSPTHGSGSVLATSTVTVTVTATSSPASNSPAATAADSVSPTR
jgi:hypothetical protein